MVGRASGGGSVVDLIKDVITWLRARASSLAIGWSLATVAVTTGFVSYTHITALTLDMGQSWKNSHLYPLFIDGQIVIGSIYFMTRNGKRRWLGLLGIVPGVAESLFANWESSNVTGSWLHVYSAHAWATVAAQAFAVSSFLFERWLKDRGSLPFAAPVLPEMAHEPEPMPESLPEREEEPRLTPELEPPRPRPHAVPNQDDDRKPLPDDPDELRRLILTTPGNRLSKTHRITRYGHSQLKTQFLNEGDRVA